MENPLKIVFFGTGNFGSPSLFMLVKNYNVLQIITPPPKAAGRGKKLQKTHIHILAESLNLSIINTTSPKISDLPDNFDIGIVISYGSLISKSILLKAKYGFLNLHPSDLPKFRGAAPIERTLEKGDTCTRICVIKMTPKLDDGDIIASRIYEIDPTQDATSLHEKFSIIGAEVLKESVDLLTRGEAKFEKQDNALSTYASKILKDELLLAPEKTIIMEGEEIINKIRAFTSYGCCHIFHEGKRIKIKQAIISQNLLTILDLPCKNGYVSPTLIKPESKNFISVPSNFKLSK